MRELTPAECHCPVATHCSFLRNKRTHEVETALLLTPYCSSSDMKMPSTSDKTVAVAASMIISLTAAVVCNWQQLLLPGCRWFFRAASHFQRNLTSVEPRASLRIKEADRLRNPIRCQDRLKVFSIGGRQDGWGRFQRWNLSSPAKVISPCPVRTRCLFITMLEMSISHTIKSSHVLGHFLGVLKALLGLTFKASSLLPEMCGVFFFLLRVTDGAAGVLLKGAFKRCTAIFLS